MNILKICTLGFFCFLLSLQISCSDQGSSGGPSGPVEIIDVSLSNPSVEGPIIIENKMERELIGDPTIDEDNTPQGLFSYTPKGTRKRETSEECRVQQIENIFQSTALSNSEKVSKTQDYFLNCEDELTRFSGKGWFDNTKISFLNYKLAKNPRIHQANFKFNNGETIRGHLGIKPSDVPRPLIIARCGVFCNAGSTSGRMMLMHLFDESPFHVLWLGNVTGTNFVEDNKKVTIGGYYEALQHFRILEYLNTPSSPLFGRISSTHVFGLSLGANASAMTSVLAQFNSTIQNQHPFKSSLSMCPVLDLNSTLIEVFKNNTRGKIMSHKAWKLLKLGYEKNNQAIPEKPKMKDFPSIISNLSLATYQSATSDPAWGLAPFLNFTFKSLEEFLSVNTYIEHSERVSEIPSLVLASKDDPVVPQRVNAEPLISKLNERNGNSSVNAIYVNEGRHCAFSTVYGWSTMSSLFRNFYLSHSPEYTEQAIERKQSLSKIRFPSSITRLEKDEFHFSQEWVTKKEDEHFTLTFKIWAPSSTNKVNCRRQNPNSAYETCFRTASVQVPFETLDVDPLYVYQGNTKSEAQAVTRWANTNLKIVDKFDQDIHFSRNDPNQVMWIDYP